MLKQNLGDLNRRPLGFMVRVFPIRRHGPIKSTQATTFSVKTGLSYDQLHLLETPLRALQHCPLHSFPYQQHHAIQVALLHTSLSSQQ